MTEPEDLGYVQADIRYNIFTLTPDQCKRHAVYDSMIETWLCDETNKFPYVDKDLADQSIAYVKEEWRKEKEMVMGYIR